MLLINFIKKYDGKPDAYGNRPYATTPYERNHLINVGYRFQKLIGELVERGAIAAVGADKIDPLGVLRADMPEFVREMEEYHSNFAKVAYFDWDVPTDVAGLTLEYLTGDAVVLNLYKAARPNTKHCMDSAVKKPMVKI